MDARLDTDDWAEAFGEGPRMERKPSVDSETPGVDPPRVVWRQDVKRILAIHEEHGDYSECALTLVAELASGLFLFVAAGCDTTGWDCQASSRMYVAMNLQDLTKVITQEEMEHLCLRRC